uniref:CD74 molecule, major histocompatibility complex, class II invariant chain a n=1 Tax=Mastacembelus armatus TaxID=205130 RepID=A0A3Q3L9S2_9TELE
MHACYWLMSSRKKSHYLCFNQFIILGNIIISERDAVWNFAFFASVFIHGAFNVSRTAPCQYQTKSPMLQKYPTQHFLEIPPFHLNITVAFVKFKSHFFFVSFDVCLIVSLLHSCYPHPPAALYSSSDIFFLFFSLRGSNSRALKVAGLVTLACLLLASQVFTAYMVFNQKQQIHTLQKNSDRMSKQLTRSSKAVAPVRMAMPMNSLPLLMDFTSDEDSKSSKTPLTKLQDNAVVSVEGQLKDLMKEFQLPEFNETFSANVQRLKQQLNDTEWISFETWMRYWLIFQMAQEKPATPTPQTATMIKTKCQLEAAPGSSKVGTYKPQCDEQGRYLPMQCWHATGFCWCVDEYGKVIEGTQMRGHPDCQRGRAVSRRTMLTPRLMQKTSFEDN